MMMSPSFYRTIHEQDNRLNNPAVKLAAIARRHIVKLLVAAAMAVILFTSFLLLVTQAAGDTIQQAAPDETIVIVSAGDTLWSIANTYADKHQDIQKFVYFIEQRNDLSSPTIYPGQSLILPGR